MSRSGQRLVAAARQALAIARGDADPATFRIHSFGRDASAPDNKEGREAEAPHPKDVVMNNVAVARHAAKHPFGIADPNAVTDLSAALVASNDARQGVAEERVRYKFLHRVEMSAAEWAAVTPNPRQRDTEAHAKKAKHLRVYDPIHQFVNMAVLPSGERFKLDGHTRSLLWSRREVIGPDTLYVDVYLCDDPHTVSDLYSRFDSQSAVETGADKLTGACREQKINFTSPMMKSGRYGTALKRVFMYRAKAWGQWTNSDLIYEAVCDYKDELIAIDALRPSPAFFTSGIIMAALATYRRRPETAKKFWTLYAADQGRKTAISFDAVEALHRAVKAMKGNKVDGGQNLQLGLLGRGIAAVEAYKREDWYKIGKGGGLRALSEPNVRDYLRWHHGV